ncbi:uncharacterized protein [Euphorbia lathyris]|uniref:uncharacterized protein isoform X2 n=1 Tax=Euphorbia lathyris TaxID=212925 RepID=UPI003313DD9F
MSLTKWNVGAAGQQGRWLMRLKRTANRRSVHLTLIWIILGMDLDECDGTRGMDEVYMNLDRVDPFHDPTTHLSRTRCNEFIEISGTTAEIHSWYARLGAAARARVRELGFEPFISALPCTNGVCDRFGLRALCERWVDSTHTFHLSFGEMTISPRDFSLLTGLRGSSTPVPFHFDLMQPRVDLARLAALIGPGVCLGARSTPAKFISTASLLSRRDFCETDDTDLAVRSFLVYTLSETIFHTKGGKVHAGLIQALSDLDTAASYDWAGAGLAFLYKFLDLTCRKRKDFGGYTFALLVWAYERRILPSQSRPRPRVPRLPLMTRWRDFDLGTERRRTVARLLDWTLGQIKFRWDDLDFGPDYMYVSVIQEQQCVLTGPCVRAWYLGDRGITGVSDAHWTPGEIPVSMFVVRTMPLSVIRQDLTRRFVGREVWVHTGGRDPYLSTLLSARDAPAAAMEVDPVADVFSREAVAVVFGQEEVPEGSWRNAHLSDFFDGTRAQTSAGEPPYYIGESSSAARLERSSFCVPVPDYGRDFATVSGAAYAGVEMAPPLFTSWVPFDPPDASQTTRETCTDYVGLSGYLRDRLSLRCTDHLSDLHAHEQRQSESVREADARVGQVYQERNDHWSEVIRRETAGRLVVEERACDETIGRLAAEERVHVETTGRLAAEERARVAKERLRVTEETLSAERASHLREFEAYWDFPPY